MEVAVLHSVTKESSEGLNAKGQNSNWRVQNNKRNNNRRQQYHEKPRLDEPNGTNLETDVSIKEQTQLYSKVSGKQVSSPNSHNKPGLSQNRSKSTKTSNSLVGTQVNISLSGEKRAWFHLGKIKNGTTEAEVKSFIETPFPGIDFIVEK